MGSNSSQSDRSTISPDFALNEQEFIERAKGHIYDALSDVAIGPDGRIENR